MLFGHKSRAVPALLWNVALWKWWQGLLDLSCLWLLNSLLRLWMERCVFWLPVSQTNFCLQEGLLHPVWHWAEIRSSLDPLNLNCEFKYVQLPGVEHSHLLIVQQRESCFCSLRSAGKGETSVLASTVLGISQCCLAFGFCSKHFPNSVSTWHQSCLRC